MADEVQQVVREEVRIVSEFLTEAICLYMDEREWLRQECRQRADGRWKDEK